jgi:DNA-binding transcriptional ArsR family regulator
MQKTELKGPELQEAYEKLRVYGVLSNPIRLEAFFLISDNPGIKFNDIAKKIKARKNIVAYHLGILKAAGLVTFKYERQGKATSSYWLTDLGKRTMGEVRNKMRKG